MATGRAARRPGRAWPENPGPRALRAETSLKFFYLRVLCATENSNFVKCLQILLKLTKTSKFFLKVCQKCQ